MSKSVPFNARHWLMKSEPDVFSIDDLRIKGKTFWDGVRNYMARNYMMKDMQVGDLILFYHSNSNPSAVVGLGRVASSARPDHSAFDKKSLVYDPKSTEENPRWYGVDIEFLAKFPNPISLDTIRREKRLSDMVLLKNSRLSVQPVTQLEFEFICKLTGHDRDFKITTRPSGTPKETPNEAR